MSFLGYITSVFTQIKYHSTEAVHSGSFLPSKEMPTFANKRNLVTLRQTLESSLEVDDQKLLTTLQLLILKDVMDISNTTTESEKSSAEKIGGSVVAVSLVQGQNYETVLPSMMVGWHQRTLAVRDRITVGLVSSYTNIWNFLMYMM